jgi:hypothetical protein
MIRMVRTAAAAAALFLLEIAPGHALTGNAPWCAVVEIGPGEVEWDCHYQTEQECAPDVVAGNRGFCNHNPYYVPQATPHATVKHPRRRHPHID